MNYDNVTLWFAKNQTGKIVTIDEIVDTNKTDKYSCPMCGSDLIPKAIKSNQVTSHFAHVDASKCSNESMIHWWFKNKFLENGDTFIVNSDKEHQYICEEVLVEQSYTIGDKIYRPDITVTTKCGKTIYFEMEYTNKKKIQDYLDIWIELKNIVVEVDIKDLMNKNQISTFKALFYDGKCFNTKKNDTYYNTIGKYKEEKFQGEIDESLKDRMKKLDWFWNDLANYKTGKIDIENVFLVIDCVDNKDKEIVFNILKKPKCIDIFQKYVDYKHDKFIKHINNYINTYYVELKNTFCIETVKKERKNITYKDILLTNDYDKYFNVLINTLETSESIISELLKATINKIVESKLFFGYIDSFYDKFINKIIKHSNINIEKTKYYNNRSCEIKFTGFYIRKNVVLNINSEKIVYGHERVLNVYNNPKNCWEWKECIGKTTEFNDLEEYLLKDYIENDLVEIIVSLINKEYKKYISKINKETRKIEKEKQKRLNFLSLMSIQEEKVKNIFIDWLNEQPCISNIRPDMSVGNTNHNPLILFNVDKQEYAIIYRQKLYDFDLNLSICDQEKCIDNNIIPIIINNSDNQWNITDAITEYGQKTYRLYKFFEETSILMIETKYVTTEGVDIRNRECISRNLKDAFISGELIEFEETVDNTLKSLLNLSNNKKNIDRIKIIKEQQDIFEKYKKIEKMSNIKNAISDIISKNIKIITNDYIVPSNIRFKCIRNFDPLNDDYIINIFANEIRKLNHCNEIVLMVYGNNLTVNNIIEDLLYLGFNNISRLDNCTLKNKRRY